MKHGESRGVNEAQSMLNSVQNPGGQREQDTVKELRQVTTGGLWSVCVRAEVGAKKGGILKDKSCPVGHVKKAGFYSNNH